MNQQSVALDVILDKPNPSILSHILYEFGNSGKDCDPYKNNNIPCYCVSEFSLIMSGVYLTFFLSSILIFMCYNCRGKQESEHIENQQCLIVLAFLIGFSIRFGYVIYTYRGDISCNNITASTSYIAFTPQAIFFLVFIWLIFKLLVIWRVMLAQNESQ